MGENLNESHEDSNEYLIEQSEEEENYQDQGQESNGDETKEKVFGALLTILKSEHPEPKKRKKVSNNLIDISSKIEQGQVNVGYNDMKGSEVEFESAQIEIALGDK